MLYKFIYYIYGHSFYIDYNNQELNDLNIVIENQSTIISIPNTQKSTTSIWSRLFILGNFLYNAVIIILLFWSIIYVLIYAIKNNVKNVINNQIFQLTFLTQYIIGIQYFNSSSYLNNIVNSTLVTQKKFQYASILSFIFTISMTLTCIILTIYDNNTKSTFLIKLYTRSKLMTGILYLNLFFNYASFFSNLTIFIFQVYNRKKILMDYTTESLALINSSHSLLDKVTQITLSFQKNKNEYDNMINELNPFFTSLNMTGMLGIGYTVKTIISNNIDPILIINAILILLTQFIYIYIVQKLRSCTQKIIDSLNNVTLFNDFCKIGKQTELTIINNNNRQDNINSNIHSLIEINTVSFGTLKVIEQVSMWKLLNDVLKTEWNSFNFFGIKLNDTTLIQKIFGLTIGYIFAQNIFNITDIVNI